MKDKSIYKNNLKNILKTLSKNTFIKIDFIYNDIDPAIYYFNKNELYLINYDHLEDKWYLALLDGETHDLKKEIYNNNYNEFIKFLENEKPSA